MHIVYVANMRMPTDRAHGVQVAKTCEAFVRAGASLELIVPRRNNPIKSDAFSYYRLKQSFPILNVPVLDTVAWGKIGFVLESLTFALGALRYAHRKESILYGRDEIVLAIILLFTKRPVVWESHTGAWNICARFVARRARAVVVISNGLRDAYLAHGIAPARILVAPDGVDLEDFAHVESQTEARARLGLPQDKKIALYAGSFDARKGTDTLFEASKYISDDVVIAVIGGADAYATRLRDAYPRIRFLGAHPYRDLPNNQAAADVLVLPTSGKDIVGARFTSPLKLFTYMAAGRPIVATDTSSAREVLDDSIAFWSRSDDPIDLARAIEDACRSPEAEHKARAARQKVALYSWESRAKRILARL